MFKISTLLQHAGYHVCIFMDSDLTGYEQNKQDARNAGIQVFDWDTGNSLEQQLFLDLPDDSVRKLLNIACGDSGGKSVRAGLRRV